MRRGRPNEQLRRCTTEGLVWQIVCRYIKASDYSLTSRAAAKLINCSLGAVGKTMAWKYYARVKRLAAADRTVDLSERRRKS